MIFFWNRREVYFGSSMQKFGEVRDILAANKIKYTYRLINRNNSSFFSPGRGHTGSFGSRVECEYEYYVYVHKKDYEEACRIFNMHLRKGRNN